MRTKLAVTLLGVFLAVRALRSGEIWSAVFWLAFLGWGLFGERAAAASKRPSRLAAHALNWLLPSLLLVGTVGRAASKDYWGVAFFSIGLGAAIVNAVYLEPSAIRTKLYGSLFGLFVIVSACAIWRTISP